MSQNLYQFDWATVIKKINNYFPLITGMLLTTPPFLILLHAAGIVSSVSLLIATVGAPTVVTLAVSWGYIFESKIDEGRAGDIKNIGSELAESEATGKFYRNLNQEIQNIDKQIIDVTYFSLAVLAVVANLFRYSPFEIYPLIASFGTYISLAATFVADYKIAERDGLQSLKQDSEIMKDGIFSHINLSGHVVYFNLFIFLVWTVVYFSFIFSYALCNLANICNSI